MKKFITLQMSVFLMLLFGPLGQYRNIYYSRVEKVIDGDTIIVKILNEKKKIRLLYIDAPEICQKENDQRIGVQSKAHLEELILYRTVKINIHGVDIYGRSLATLYLGNKFVNLEMVARGYAFVYPYSKFLSYQMYYQFMGAERNAMILKRGVWKKFKMVNSPASYRKRAKKVTCSGL